MLATGEKTEFTVAVDGSPDGITEPEFLDAETLLKLPATDALERELERAQATMHTYVLDNRRQSGPLHPAEVARRTTIAERRLRWGQARDAIQARRPGGCTCLGTGSQPTTVRGVLYGVVRRYYGDDYEHDFVFEAYCPCPDGERVHREHRTRRSGYGMDAETARRQRLWADARVPEQYAACTFDTYPQTTATASSMAQIRRWAVNDSNPFLLIWGAYGTGKTGLSISALRTRVLDHGDVGLFAPLPDLLHQARLLIPEGGMHRFIEQVRQIPLLVLDDVAAEKASEFVDQTLFVILDYRKSHQLRTVCTSNLDPAALGEYVGKRIMWRVLDSAEVVHLDGPNLRDRKPAAAKGRRA